MIFYFSYLFYYSTSATVLSKFNTDSSLKSLAFNILFNITPTIAAKLNPVKQSLEPTINPANNEFIKKLRYVDNELSNNKEYATDPTLNGGKGDGLSVRVWWDTARYK